MIESLEALQARLEYQFKDISLLQQALTHRSANRAHNERLEFLGDAVLGLVAAETLFETYPQAPEGDLSRLRANLVKRDALCLRSRRLQIAEVLRLGPGELKSGGFRRESILADTLEAVYGAIYLDGGFEAVRLVIRSQLSVELADLEIESQLKDPKSALQEWLQARGQELPIYELVDSTGKDHQRCFNVRCVVMGYGVSADAVGQSRKRAEQGAAEKVLHQLVGTHWPG